MKMLYNVVVKDDKADTVEIIARSYDKTAVSNFVKKNWANHLPSQLFFTAIRADAVLNPFKSTLRLEAEPISTGVDTHVLQRHASQRL